MIPYTSDAATEQRHINHKNKLRQAADKRAMKRGRDWQHYLGSQLGAQRYLQKAYANGARTFPQEIYERANAGIGQKPAVKPTKENRTMSNQQFYEITKIELAQTEKGQQIINLFGQPHLKYPVLTLFDLHLLFDVGIDPNDLTEGSAIYARFRAYYEESEKQNGQGNNYKNVSHLEGRTATTQTADLLADVLMELKAQTALLLSIATSPETTAPPQNSDTESLGRAQPSPTPATTETEAPHPATRPDRQAITHTNGRTPQQPDSFDYQYGDGTAVPDNETTRVNFNRYRRAHNEQPPTNTATMVTWLRQQ